MSQFLGPLDSTGRVPPHAADAGRFIPDVRAWRAGATARDRPARPAQGRLANRIERTASIARRKSFPCCCVRQHGCRIWRYPGLPSSWEAAWLPKPVEGVADLRQALAIDIAALGHAVAWGDHGRPPCCRSRHRRKIPFVMALRRIEFESGRLIQAQILFLKSDDLKPLRDAVNSAVETRHAQVRKLWTEMLDGIGVRRSDPDALAMTGSLDADQGDGQPWPQHCRVAPDLRSTAI